MVKKLITKGAICLSLAYILGFCDIFKLPFGGGISLESIPLMIFSSIAGPIGGFIACFTYGLMMLTKPSAFVHPIQFLLDYPLAFSSFFILGFLKENRKQINLWLMSILAFCLRAFWHILSGLLLCKLFLKQLPENVTLYVLSYNASYIVPTAIICTIIFSFLYSKLKNYFKDSK